jgi:hypothetical protein
MRAKSRGLSAAGWFYAQSFNSSAYAKPIEQPKPVAPVADEDPPCACIRIREDLDDATYCPVHGNLPETNEPMFSTAARDLDVAF